MAVDPITVNYDGKNKFLTKIEDGAHLLAVIQISWHQSLSEKGAYVRLVQRLQEDVPQDALSIARADKSIKKIM
ncbi:hypothetical protein ACEQPO_30980 [Bacillus sp. SL00103]